MVISDLIVSDMIESYIIMHIFLYLKYE